MSDSDTKDTEKTFLPEPKNRGGNPAWQKGGPSPNPAGRPKGIPSVAGDVKESIIKIFQSVNGVERLIKIINPKQPTKKADIAFMSFVKNILIPILPKKTEYEVEKRVVIFDLGDGNEERFEQRDDPDNVFDVEAEDVREVDDEGTGEGSPDPEKRE